MKRRIVGLIQQRMGSQRFPQKAIADVAGKPLTWRVAERLARSKHLDELAIIVPVEAETGMLLEAMEGGPAEILSFKMSPRDVLGRHQRAAQKLQADIIVRVPGDNPCVDPAEVDRMIEFFLHKPQPTGQWLFTNLDMNVMNNGYPGGIGCEMYSAWFLHWLHANMFQPAFREHPHKWAFDSGRLKTVQAPRCAPSLKLSVDTPDDLAMINAIYKRCPDNFSLDHILDFIGALPHGEPEPQDGRTDSPGTTRSWHLDDAAQPWAADAGDGGPGDGVPGPAHTAPTSGQPRSAAFKRAFAAIRGLG